MVRGIFSILIFLISVSLMEQFAFEDLNKAEADDACGVSVVCNCSIEGIVDCRDRKLSSLPSNIPRNIFYLLLERNDINDIPYRFMTDFELLLTLKVGSNNIKHPFQLPRSLKKFSCSNNSLTSFHAFFETGCENLLEVDLSRNQVSTIHDGTFQDCTKLLHITIADNRLRHITNETLKGLTGLRLLRIDNNPLTSIESGAFSDICKSLDTLIAKDLRALSTIPAGLFRHCHFLKELYFTRCNLKRFPEKMFLGIESFKLTVSGNHRLTTLPENLFFGVNKMMFVISLTTNNLTSLPANLFRNVSIEGEINLGFNRLTELPPELFRTPNRIENLLLHHNKISYIPRGFFQYLPHLKIVALFGSKLENLLDGMFWGTRVEQIFLFRNNIKTVQGEPFKTGLNSSISYLDLRDNPLENLSGKSMFSLVPNATVHLVCDSLILPNHFKDLTMTCAIHGEVINILIMGRSNLRYALIYGGFVCANVPKREYHMINCTTCPTGTYGRKLTEGCNPCPAGGFYQDEVGTFTEDSKGIFCKTCRPGTYVPFGEGTSLSSCQVCPEGTDKQRHAGFRACFCLKKHYRRNRFDKCFVCPDEGLECLQDFVRIKSGYYWDWRSSDIESYKRFVENLQIFNESYDKDTATFNATLPKSHKCPVKEACINSTDDLRGNCQQGYSGWQCTVCVNGYYKLFGRCRKCTSTWAIVPKVLIFAVFLVAFLRVIAIQSRLSQIPGSINQSMYVTQRFSIDKVVSRAKIVIGFYQVVSYYWYCCGTFIWSPVFQIVVMEVMTTFSISLTSMLYIPGCLSVSWNAHIQLKSMYIGYSTFFAILLLSYFILKIVKSRCKESLLPALPVLRAYVVKISVVTLFVTYTETCKIAFQLFNCDSFFLDQNENTSVRFLHSDYSIDCDSTSHVRYRLLTVPLLAYVVVFPVALFFTLRKWAEVQLADKYPPWAYFFCENYRSDCWYWELVELIRKFTLTIIPTMFGLEGFSMICGLSFSVFFICIHIHMNPLKAQTENRLQLISLLLVNFNMSLAASGLWDVNKSVVFIYFIVISCLNIGFLFLVIGKGISGLCRLAKMVSGGIRIFDTQEASST